MTQEPTYEDVDPETGDTLQSAKNRVMKDALEPKTPLQVKLMLVSKAKRFASSNDRKRWKKLEDKAKGVTEENRVFYAWLVHCIEWGMKKNRPQIIMPFMGVAGMAENEAMFEEWAIKNREKVLKKKETTEVQAILNQKLDELHNEEE